MDLTVSPDGPDGPSGLAGAGLRYCRGPAEVQYSSLVLVAAMRLVVVLLDVAAVHEALDVDDRSIRCVRCQQANARVPARDA